MDTLFAETPEKAADLLVGLDIWTTDEVVNSIAVHYSLGEHEAREIVEQAIGRDNERKESQ